MLSCFCARWLSLIRHWAMTNLLGLYRSCPLSGMYTQLSRCLFSKVLNSRVSWFDLMPLWFRYSALTGDRGCFNTNCSSSHGWMSGLVGAISLCLDLECCQLLVYKLLQSSPVNKSPAHRLTSEVFLLISLTAGFCLSERFRVRFFNFVLLGSMRESSSWYRFFSILKCLRWEVFFVD